MVFFTIVRGKIKITRKFNLCFSLFCLVFYTLGLHVFSFILDFRSTFAQLQEFLPFLLEQEEGRKLVATVYRTAYADQVYALFADLQDKRLVIGVLQTFLYFSQIFTSAVLYKTFASDAFLYLPESKQTPLFWLDISILFLIFGYKNFFNRDYAQSVAEYDLRVSELDADLTLSILSFTTRLNNKFSNLSDVLIATEGQEAFNILFMQGMCS